MMSQLSCLVRMCCKIVKLKTVQGSSWDQLGRMLIRGEMSLSLGPFRLQRNLVHVSIISSKVSWMVFGESELSAYV